MASPLSTIDPGATLQTRQEHFEKVWRSWRRGEPLPRWQDFLPTAAQPCSAEFVLLLLKTDVEFRVKAGLPALLVEPYFQQQRLQADDARLDASAQQELIRWEY